MSELCDTLEILKVALGRIEQGWTKGTLRSGDKVCSIGAIIPANHSSLYSAETRLAGKYVYEALSAQSRRVYDDTNFEDGYEHRKHEHAIINYNDADHRCKDHVVKVFEKAIKAVIKDVEQGNGKGNV